MRKKRFTKKYNAIELFAMIAATATIVAVIWLNYSEKNDETVESDLSQSTETSEVYPSDLSTLQATSQLSNSTQRLPITILPQAASIPAKDRVKFKIDHFKKLALQPLEFQVFDEKQKPLTPDDLKLVDGQKIHFIVVSANLQEFQHLNPTFEKGKWKTLAYMPTPGTYYAYTVVSPLSGKSVVLRSDLIVRDPSKNPISYPKISDGLKAKSDSGNYFAQLNLTKPSVLQQTILAFALLDEAGAPLEGEAMHVTALRHGEPDSFMHLQLLPSSDSQKNLAEFVAAFSKAGTYTAFAEFKILGKVRVFAVTFAIS